MSIKVPHNCAFSQSLKTKILKETECPLPEWEISVSSRDDVAWSIVLSYLLSTNNDKKDDFSRRLKALTGNDNDVKLVRKSISYFNPFRNRFSCFYDKVLKKVVNDFKANLNWYVLIRVSDKLSAASRFLNCRILHMWDDPEIGKYKTFMEDVNIQEGMITLKSNFIDYNNEGNKIFVYNFLIENSLGSKMKRAALQYFLKEVKMSRKEISKTMKSVQKEENNLLILLLKKRYYSIIRKLYKSPYIVSKISEAGYILDPRSKDNDGSSAVWHALGNSEILYMLYFFAVNNCFLSEGSYRNPDSCIVSNLHQMEEILSNDRDNFKVIKSSQKRHLDRIFDELLKFNKFLIVVNGNIVKIKNKINYFESVEDDVFEAEKRRDLIVTLLDTYKDFFNVIQQKTPVLSSLDDFILHKNYYNLIDTATAIIFFDNIVFLKERLALDDSKQFSEMESSFCLSVIYLETFRDIEKEQCQLNYLIDKSLYSFALSERLHNFEKTKEFSEMLRDTNISIEKTRKCIPESEIYSTLHSYPEFKDVIQKNRLQFHTETALSVKITNIQSVLVIERTLQVIGECLIQEKDDDNVDSFLRRFLHLCLPEELPSMLVRVRNELTHLKGHAFPSKFECEKNFSLFRAIQSEILEIEGKIKIVYGILNLNLYTYCAKQLEKELEQEKVPLSMIESGSQYINDHLKSIFRKSEHFYIGFFEIVLNRSEEKIKNEMSRLDSRNCKILDIINKVRYTLRPLQWLLELVKRCDVYSVDSILDIFKALESYNDENVTILDFQEQIEILLGLCKSLLSAHATKKRKKINQNSLRCFKYIEYFLKILKGFVFLSNGEKDNIRKEIPQSIVESVQMKAKLLLSIKDGFSYDIDEAPDIKISYFSEGKMKELKDYYRSKDSYVSTILEKPDPIQELEEIFSKNCAEKRKYDYLCEIMQFSEGTRKKLGKLVAGQRKKSPGNNLENLHNRIQLLKKVIIEENAEVFRLWIKIISPKSRQLIIDRIVQRYLNDPLHEVAVDMLLFDCMILFQTEKGTENAWIKTSKLYSGINLRNVISQGSPLLEFLCDLLDPEDLPLEKIKKIMKLIEDEDAVKAIIELYNLLNCDFEVLLKIINSEEKDEFCDFRKRIKKCDEWKDYALLLPYSLKSAKKL